MPVVDEMLADLAAHPPVGPTPVGEIRGRARRRARRRRALTGVAAAVVLVGVGVGVGAAVTADDPGQDVHADGGTTTEDRPTTPSTTPPTSAPVTVSGDPTVVIEPATGHVDGSVVAMALTEPASGEAVVAQCAAEAQYVQGAVGLQAWCTGIVTARADALEPYRLSRTVETPAGTVDCAEAAGRCALGVRVGGMSSTDDRFAPLVFRPPVNRPTEPTVVVDGDEGTVGDGDRLLVTVTGVETGDLIHVQQCIPGTGRCDEARARTTQVQDGPETQLTFTAFHDVYVDRSADPQGDEPGWTICAPCEVVVRVGDVVDGSHALPLEMEPTVTPIRPSVAIEPAGPHRWGDAVTVRASGLQPSDDVPIGWCPTTVPQGGGASACWSEGAQLPAEHLVGADGTVVVEGFVLPSPDSFVGTDCGVPGACGVGVDGGDPASLLAVAPLDLGG